MKKNMHGLVLKIGAMGGSLSVWSVKAKDGTISFLVERDESTLKEFMDEDDAKGLSFKSKTGPLHSFTDALIALGRHPWHLMSPIFVHPDFIEPVLATVMKRGGEKELNRWRRKLEFIKKEANLTLTNRINGQS